MDGFVYDIEGDNLYPAITKVWYLRAKSLDGKKTFSCKPYIEEDATERFIEWMDSFEDGCYVVGHNILGFDNWALWKLMGIRFRVGKKGKDYFGDKPVQFIDTYYLSLYLAPDMIGHSLEDWGYRVGVHKIDYRQTLIDAGLMQSDDEDGKEFSFFNEYMVTYCDQDVDTNLAVFGRLWANAVEMYEDSWLHPSFRMGQKAFFLMAAQSITGVYFHKDKAAELEPRIIALIEGIASEVEPELPLRPLKKGEEKYYTMPAKPFKKNGEWSSHMISFTEKHKAITLNHNTIECYGKQYKIEGNLLLDVQVPMELKDQDAIKDFFLSQGWEPTYYNFKKDTKGKAMRDPKTRELIFTTPKLQEAGKICPNLLELDGDLPKKIVKYLSLRNRLGVLQGWLSNPRLERDGRLSARASKITNTHRQAHAEVCNVPKASDDVLLGKEFRGLFGVADGFTLVGTDAAALENRLAGAYTYKYDGGFYADLVLNGDSHSKNAKVWFPLETKNFDPDSPDFNKDDPAFKPYRNKAKTGIYAVLYGCSPGKLAKTLGKPEKQGKVLYDAFWDNNLALKELKEAVEEWWVKKGNKKYLPAIDGRLLSTRSKHSLLNILFQSAGAIAMDVACGLMDSWLGEMYLDDHGRPYYLYKDKIVKRVVYYHK